MTSHAARPADPAAMLHDDLSHLSDISLLALARLVAPAADASGIAANRQALISTICSGGKPCDANELEAGWVDLKPTPLHTPPSSPTTTCKTLPAQLKVSAPGTDAVWRTPRWTPVDLVAALAPAGAARPPPVRLEADATLADRDVPFWAGKAVQAGDQSRDGGWKAPRWARSPSPMTRARERAGYVAGWQAEAAPFAWSAPEYAAASRAGRTHKHTSATHNPSADVADWSPPAWAIVAAPAAC